MTSKLTRERLEELAAGQSGFNLRIATHEESQELARMALAALDTEPVGEFYEDGPLNWYQISDGDRVPAHRRIPLYRHAQPAPVVQCPYPCGWDTLNKLAIQDAAFVALALVAGEPATESIRSAVISNNDRLLKVISFCRDMMPQAGNSPAIPDGYVMVPKEPTAEMIWAAKYCFTSTPGWDVFKSAYIAMLAAAPQEDINALIPVVSRDEQEGK